MTAMTAMTTETWLDVMPELTLAGAVPCVLKRGAPPMATHPDGKRVVTTISAGGGAWFTGCGSTNVDTNEHRYLVVRPKDVRVDLDDPQGFAYALRMAVREAKAFLMGEFQEQGRTPASATAHLGGLALGLVAPTDADRLVIARTLAEVR